jgi:small subunit ribosomal protein S17
MADTPSQSVHTEPSGLRRKIVIGKVVSSRMNKTIVVETKRQYSHRLYARVIARSKKFYAHDENNSARVGDFVKLEETRPLSKLKRWRLVDVVQRAKLAEEPKSAGGAAKAS